MPYSPLGVDDGLSSSTRLAGRFDGAAAKAPFPAVLVIFRPGQLREMGEPVPVSMLVVPKGC